MDSPGQDQYLIFNVASQQCATPIIDVCEVVLMAQLSTPVGLSPAVVGILNLGGEAIPVLNLSYLLGIEECEAGLYSHILLARTQYGTTGFLTLAVKKVLTIPSRNLKPMPSQTSLQGFAHSMIADGKDFVAILSLAAIATACEQELRMQSATPSIGLVNDQLGKAS